MRVGGSISESVLKEILAAPAWMDEAACVGLDVFDTEAMSAACADCPVFDTCRDDVLARFTVQKNHSGAVVAAETL